MEFKRNTLLDSEILKVIGKSAPFDFPEFTFVLHNKDIDFVLTHVTKYHVERDYNNNITDNILVEFALPEGYYKNWIIENKDSLEMTIQSKIFGKTVKNRYKFIPLLKDDNILSGSKQVRSEESLNKHKLKQVIGQCINTLLLTLKPKYISGVYHKVTLEELYTALMTKELDKTKVFGKSLNYKLMPYTFDNVKKYNNIPIKTGTKLIKLADYFQNDLYGIYDSGCNTYFTNINADLTDDTYNIYTYPLYSRDRYNEDTKYPVLDILNASEIALGNSDASFRYTSGHYKVIATYVHTITALEQNKYNTATGIRMVLPFNITNYSNYPTTRCVKTGFDPSKHFLDAQLDVKLNNYQNLKMTDLDADIYRELTIFNKHQSYLLEIKLPKLNIEILYPGMPVSYLYPYKDTVKLLTGVLQKVTADYNIVKKSNSVTIIVSLREPNE